MLDILENRADWEATFRDTWLAHYQATGETKWDIYPRPNQKIAPAGKGIDLSKSRLLLISSAGGYLKNSQEPFNAADDLGDYSLRMFPLTTRFDALAYAHDHYDHTAVDADPQVLLPLRHLEAMVEEGKIGEVASTVISFSGYMPDISRLLDETIPEILTIARAEMADAALLVPS